MWATIDIRYVFLFLHIGYGYYGEAFIDGSGRAYSDNENYECNCMEPFFNLDWFYETAGTPSTMDVLFKDLLALRWS